MVTYIYFVKCPNCEDEHFDFFDEAKGFAMGCLSKKPIITQTEVNRNDFGECTDHCDLGTVWSWEDAVGKDDESKTPVFTKDNLKNYDPDNDPEFADDPIGFLIDDEEEAVAGYEQVAEVVTDSDFENKEEIAGAHAKGAELSTEYATTGISVPFHPGAEKYFKEVGAIK